MPHGYATAFRKTEGMLSVLAEARRTVELAVRRMT